MDIFCSYVFLFFCVALRFEEIKDAEVWHDTVRVFSVWDGSSSDLLGYFFLDIFARFVPSAY
jgi:Zn-dependent oligopeptidase